MRFETSIRPSCSRFTDIKGRRETIPVREALKSPSDDRSRLHALHVVQTNQIMTMHEKHVPIPPRTSVAVTCILGENKRRSPSPDLSHSQFHSDVCILIIFLHDVRCEESLVLSRCGVERFSFRRSPSWTFVEFFLAASPSRRFQRS